MESSLTVICEGGAHMVEYLHRNGVYPNSVVFETEKFQEMLPYLSGKDNILLIINGLTDFTVSGIYALLKTMSDVEDKLESVTILSNVNLGHIVYPYHLYEGDLFYSQTKEIIHGKEVLVEKKRRQRGRKNRNEKDMDEGTTKFQENKIIEPFKKYGRRKVRLTIYGTETKEETPQHNLDSITKKLIEVDLFRERDHK